MRLIFALFVLALAGHEGAQSAKILSINTFNSTSHHMWLTSLTSALASRGHQVTQVDFIFPKKKIENMKTLIIEQSPASADKYASRLVDVFASGTSFEKVDFIYEMHAHSCEYLYEISPYKELMSPEFPDKFDLILYNYNMQDCLLGLIHRFDYPAVVLAAPFATNPHWVFRAMRTPVFHAVPHYFDEFNMPLTFYERLRTLVTYLYDDYRYTYNYVPIVDAALREKVSPDIPSVEKLVENAVVALVNIPASDYKVPLPANVIPVGGLHLTPPKPLPADLKKFLDDAKDGAVLMSFGSIVRGDSIEPQKRDAILKAFAGIRQRVLWKWESAEEPNAQTPDVPANVRLQKWLPQTDILAHPNMRLFISHCGGMSSLESSYHGVPLLAMPFFLDQLTTANRVVAEGKGLRLDIGDVNETSFKETLHELLDNPTYREAASKSKMILQEQPQHPLERAVFWVEFAARHRGAPHMKSPAAQLPWFHYSLLLDILLVFLALIVSIGVAVALVRRVARFLHRKLFAKAATRTSSQKKRQ